MLIYLLALFIIIPFIELMIIIEIGKRIGTIDTIALIVLTGMAGAYLVKLQGIQTIVRIQHDLQHGIFPAEKLIDGLFIVIAGALLITPGVVTDIFGLCLLVPPIRTHIKEILKKWMRKRFQTNDSHFTTWTNA